ncbi:hypothetical protein EJB05_09364, partial [Eragrostis curvula]
GFSSVPLCLLWPPPGNSIPFRPLPILPKKFPKSESPSQSSLAAPSRSSRRRPPLVDDSPPCSAPAPARRLGRWGGGHPAPRPGADAPGPGALQRLVEDESRWG